MPKIQAVLFDLDGTLVDSFQDITNSVNFVLNQQGKAGKTPEEVKAHVGLGLRHTLKSALGVEDGDFPEEAVVMFREHYWEHCVDNTYVYDGVVQCLRELDNYPKAVVTNKRKAYAEKILSALGIRDYMVRVFGGEEYPAMKPDAAAVIYACEEIGVEVGSTVMVGDGFPDIRAAASAGAIACAVTYGIGPVEGLKKEGARYFLNSLTQLKGLIERMEREENYSGRGG